MPRARDPNRDKAFEIWKKYEGNITNREIAKQLDVPEKTVSGWKSKDKWNDKLNGVLQSKIRSTPNKKTPKKERPKNKKELEEPIVESDELTDKQKLFCIYYVKYFNATKAYQKAYECDYFTANANGSRLLAKASIKQEIQQLKQQRMYEAYFDKYDVLQKYKDIAFADITDYATFGKREVPVIGMYGPVLDENDNQVMQEVNYVDFKESSMVDGTIIAEVKQGKDGVSVKLADKMKALDFLAKYTDLLNENELKQLKVEREKIAIRKESGDDGDEYEDDGFLDALKGIEVDWDE